MTKIEILKELYSALNRNDIPTIMDMFDPQILRVETWDNGTYKGLVEVREHFNKGRSTWAEGGCEPEAFTTVGNKIIVSVHVHVRQKDKQEWIDGHTADVYMFHDGKITEMRSFLDIKEAIRWANVI